MSVRKETYLIYGLKFGEEFTEEFFEKDFSDDNQYFDEKDNGKIMFLSDGMNGDYTFFGQITELDKKGEWYEDEIKELSFDVFSEEIIINKFKEFYPDIEVQAKDVKLYYVPHYV